MNKLKWKKPWLTYTAGSHQGAVVIVRLLFWGQSCRWLNVEHPEIALVPKWTSPDKHEDVFLFWRCSDDVLTMFWRCSDDVPFQRLHHELSSLCLRHGWLLEPQWLSPVGFHIRLQDGGSTGTELTWFIHIQSPDVKREVNMWRQFMRSSVMSCSQEATEGLNRTLPSSKAWRSQQNMHVELEEETPCFTLSTVIQSGCGLEVSLFLSLEADVVASVVSYFGNITLAGYSRWFTLRGDRSKVKTNTGLERQSKAHIDQRIIPQNLMSHEILFRVLPIGLIWTWYYLGSYARTDIIMMSLWCQQTMSSFWRFPYKMTQSLKWHL